MGKHGRRLSMWRLKSLLRRVRNSFVPLLCGSSLLFSANCGLSTSDLRWSHPDTPIYAICDKPLDVPEDIDLWGFNYATKQLVTAEDPAELRGFYGADAFFEFVPDAPVSSASRMPPEYGLTCVKRATSFADASALFFTPASELFRSKEPCPAQVAETVGRVEPHLLAAPAQAKAPCGTPKKAPKRVHVCVHPPGIGDKVDEWTSKDSKGDLLTNSDKVFAEATAKAEFIFVFDTTALPQSVCWFKDPEKLRCPGKHVPKVCNQAVLSELMFAESANSYRDSVSENPKKGDGKTTDTSSDDGKGPPLNFLETLSRNLQYVAALSSGDTSGDPKNPNGSRNGILSGKNVGGPDLLILQAAAGTFAILGIPFKKGGEFIEAVKRAVTEGKVTVILNPIVLTKEIAEELAKNPTAAQVEKALKGEIVESYGMAMAISLRDAAVILPYSRAQIFTKGWEAKFQAHHILEVNMFGKLWKEELTDNGPAVILAKADHEAVTTSLATLRKKLLEDTAGAPSKEQVWAMYQKAYEKYPNWLKAIKHYF